MSNDILISRGIKIAKSRVLNFVQHVNSWRGGDLYGQDAVLLADLIDAGDIVELWGNPQFKDYCQTIMARYNVYI